MVSVRRFFVILFAFVLVGCTSTPNADQAGPVAVGAPAPALALPTLDGTQTVDLEELRGSVVLLNFWAAWCEPCTREMPRFQQWSTQFAADGLVVVGVNTLYQDQRAAAEAFVQANTITYPIVVDEAGDVRQPWLIQGLPRTYVIDRNGVVRAQHAGEFNDQDFAAAVAPLLGR